MPLRNAVVELMRARGIQSSVERTVVTTGSQQGLDLIARVLLDPGDVALLELSSYTGAISAFRNVGPARALPAPFFVDGSGKQYLRLSFSAPPPDRIEEGVARLAAAVGEMTSLPPPRGQHPPLIASN